MEPTDAGPGDPAISIHMHTTEINRSRGRIVSLGLCRSDSLERKCWILNTGGKESQQAAFLLHGIPLHISNLAPVLPQCMDEILEFVGGRTMIGHNAAIFQYPFLQNTLKRYGIALPDELRSYRWRDTLKISRKCFLQPHRMQDFAINCNILDVPGYAILRSSDLRAWDLARCWNSETLKEEWEGLTDIEKKDSRISEMIRRNQQRKPPK